MANDDSCSSCGGQHRVMYVKDQETGKIRRVEVQQEAMVSIDVEFTGSRVGGFSVAGAVTKRQYRFSNFDRIKAVDEQDVEGVLQHPYGFRLVGGPAISRPVQRRGDPPNMNAPIAVPQKQSGQVTQISAAEAAARAVSSPKGVGAEGRPPSGSGRPTQQNPQRIAPRRDTLNTTKVNPRTLGL